MTFVPVFFCFLATSSSNQDFRTFSAKALVSALCPTSSGTFTPAQPIHLASKSFTPSKELQGFI